ncbi:hypothetical protein GDO86_018796, partial [Hymenochirus boettgeri]
TIYSIWFYDKDDCQRISKLMMQVVQQESEKAKKRKSQSAVNGSAQCSIDILEMLSKAKNEYEQAFPAVQRHLTVEELFGTSLQKEQPPPACHNADTGHPLYFPGCEQPKPVVVKAGCTNFNSIASDFSQSGSMAAPLSTSQSDSSRVANLIRLSPSLSFVSGSECSSVPMVSSNPTYVLNTVKSVPRQISPLISQPVPDQPLLPPLVPITVGSAGNTLQSSTNLLHKLKLTSQVEPACAPATVKSNMAPTFSSTLNQLATPDSFKGRNLLISPLQTGLDKKDCDHLPQPKSLPNVVATLQYVCPTSTVTSSVLLSPSVFEQSVQKSTGQEEKSGTPPNDTTNDSNLPLNKSQLQETLIHLIK